MSFSNWCFCVLAAGLGKRMYSSQPKVVLPVLGKPLINYLLDKGFQNHFGTVMTVVSPFTLQAIRGVVDPEVKLVVQENPLGTADAVKSIIPFLDAQVENVLVVYADMPLLEENTLTSLVTFFEMKKVPVALLTASSPFPGSFGRVIRDEGGNPVRIVEEKDCTPEEQVIHEINLGIYAFRKEFLSPILFSIGNANVQGEYYLTDVLEVATTQHISGEVMTVEWGSQFINVNSPRDFAAVAGILRDRKNDSLLNLGVKLVDPQNIYVDWEATCEPDVWLYPGTMIEGKSEVEAGSLIGPFTRLKNTRVGRGCRIEYSVVEDCVLEDGVTVGPFAHLRMESRLSQGTRVGNFVEIKKSIVGAGTRALHLSYIGDAQLGKKVNIGAGTITCNFDGKKKNLTIIQDDVFIGSNNSLVAPVTIGEGSYTAAGSTITRDVPPLSLGIGRAKQVNIEGWVEKKKKQEMTGK